MKKIKKSERISAFILAIFFLTGAVIAYLFEIAPEEDATGGSIMFVTTCSILITYVLFVALSGRRPWI